MQTISKTINNSQSSSEENLATQGSSLSGLTISGLSYSYRGLQVFQDFSLQANSNIIVLRGASGCGKTTLLKLLSANLQPDKAESMPETSGSCLVLQEDSLLPWLSGNDNISKFTGIKAEQFKQHAMYGLIAGFIDNKACRMSYGQRRMVELFRALVYQPKFLYLDEPFNFLDEDNMSLIVPFLQSFACDGRTLVLSNHHKEDGGIINCADIFKFDGQFPVRSLKRVN